MLRVPPPWHLAGDGWIFLFTLRPWFLRNGRFLPPELMGDDFEGELGAVMLVDYRESPVGPYRELLFLAGRNRRWRNHRFSVLRIYVSTEASAVSGRENWALPKVVGDFEVIPQKDGSERVIVLRDGLAEVDLTVASGGGPPLPALSFIAPPSWRTIEQYRDGKVYRTRLSGMGVAKRAELRDFRTEPTLFPDVDEGRLLAGFRIERFRLRLPRPEITPAYV